MTIHRGGMEGRPGALEASVAVAGERRRKNENDKAFCFAKGAFIRLKVTYAC
jgi:hypothetical protein